MGTETGAAACVTGILGLEKEDQRHVMLSKGNWKELDALHNSVFYFPPFPRPLFLF